MVASVKRVFGLFACHDQNMFLYLLLEIPKLTLYLTIDRATFLRALGTSHLNRVIERPHNRLGALVSELFCERIGSCPD